jgi:hypothetical protein
MLKKHISTVVSALLVCSGAVSASNPSDGRMVFTPFAAQANVNPAAKSLNLSENQTIEHEILLFVQPTYFSVFGPYESYRRLEGYVDFVNTAYVTSGIDAHLTLVDIVTMESVADDVPFNDGLDADGNIIADGAEYLASLAIQNAGSPEYEIYEKWQADHSGYMREFRQEDSARGTAGLRGNFLSVLDDGNDERTDNTFAHEVGHNLGANHQFEETYNPVTAYEHAVICDGKSTIMYSGGTSTSHNFYSSPDISVNGEVCGNADNADNTRVIRENLPRAANHRPGVESKGTVSFAQTSYVVMEDETLVVELTRDGDIEESASVKVFATNGTALWGEDFSDVFVEAVFEAGDTQTSVSFNIVNDITEEDNEAFTLELKYPYKLSADPMTADVVIQPVAPMGYAGEFTLSGPEQVIEGEGAVFTITRSGGSAGDVIINAFIVEGTATESDFIPLNTNIIFADGETVKTFSVITGQDTQAEVTESIEVMIGSAETVDLSTTALALDILDNDSVSSGVFSLNAAQTSVSENVGNISFTVTRVDGFTGNVTGSVDAGFTNGSTALSVPFTLVEGLASVDVVLTVPNNGAEEASYKMEATLVLSDTSIEITSGNVSVDIADDDNASVSNNGGDSGGGALGWLLIGVMSVFGFRRYRA